MKNEKYKNDQSNKNKNVEKKDNSERKEHMMNKKKSPINWENERKNIKKELTG